MYYDETDQGGREDKGVGAILTGMSSRVMAVTVELAGPSPGCVEAETVIA